MITGEPGESDDKCGEIERVKKIQRISRDY
jgi:hypothetical protein